MKHTCISPCSQIQESVIRRTRSCNVVLRKINIALLHHGKCGGTEGCTDNGMLILKAPSLSAVIPFIEVGLRFIKSVFKKLLIYEISRFLYLGKFIGVYMPGIEIKRTVILFNEGEEIREVWDKGFIKIVKSFAEHRVEATAAVAADLDIREPFFQMHGGHAIKVEELLLRSLPHRRILRLIPNLPILNTVGKAVCPSFIVMHDYMLADARPFCKILGRN